ncbi:MAG: hypothetical protein CM1200mP10_20740 [Candidatus Neomarinimicrobiota bacterium]|nr:MAG: hypothetical protein CM1200mP10_20740 [Candidatus Neomarinimicrobiota bacterium]
METRLGNKKISLGISLISEIHGIGANNQMTGYLLVDMKDPCPLVLLFLLMDQHKILIGGERVKIRIIICE